MRDEQELMESTADAVAIVDAAARVRDGLRTGDLTDGVWPWR